MKGMKLVSKKDRGEDFFPAAKKGKKGKGKENRAEPSAGKYSCPRRSWPTATRWASTRPCRPAEVPGVIEKVKAKLDHWKSDQAAQTEKASHFLLSCAVLILTVAEHCQGQEGNREAGKRGGFVQCQRSQRGTARSRRSRRA